MERKPSSPLLGSPIELTIPAGVSQSRGGGLPARGSGVIVFETKAEKGNSRQQRVAEGPPGGDRIEGPGAVDDRVAQLQAAELGGRRGPNLYRGRHQWPDPGTSAVAICSPRTTGPSTQSRM